MSARAKKRAASSPERAPSSPRAARTKRPRAVAVNPELDPGTYAKTYVAALIGGQAKALQTIADEMSAGANPVSLRARLDASVSVLASVSEGLREARPGARQNPEAPPDYQRAHWGIAPTGLSRMAIPEPKANKTFVALGELVSISYLTIKGGDSAPTEYVHRFKKTLPVLVYGKKNARLYIAGGSYTVTTRGIEG